MSGNRTCGMHNRLRGVLIVRVAQFCAIEHKPIHFDRDDGAALMVSGREILHRMPQRVAAGRNVLLNRGWLTLTPPDFQEALLDLVIWRTAEEGQEFSHVGDTDGGLIALAAGSAEVATSFGHPDTRFLYLAHPGYWAGYRPLIGKARNLSLVARSNVLWALVPKLAIERLLKEVPRHWRNILLMSDLAFETALQGALDLSRQRGLSRAAGTLLRLAGCRQFDPEDLTSLEIRVPQAEIATIAVMSRGTFVSYLNDLAARGLVSVRYRKITILNTSGLRHIMEVDE